MTSPTRSISTSFGRFYKHYNDSSAFDSDPYNPYAPKPSITNVIGAMDKKFLPPYYAKLVAEYAVDNLDEIAGWRDKFGRDTAIGTVKSIVNKPHPAAAVGDEVHAAIDLWVRHKEDNVPLPLEFATITATRMFGQWLNFYDQYAPIILRSEYTVWSYRHAYAGTGDLMWQERDGYTWIIDVKTGSSIHAEAAVQVAAIGNADVILDDTEDYEIPLALPPDVKYGILHLRPMSAKLYEVQNINEAWETFKACRQVFQWQTKTSFDAFGPVPLVFQKGKA